MKVSTILAFLIATPVFSAPQGPQAETDDILCTTEYDPTVCQYGELRFAETNACLARAALESYAKHHSLILEESAIVCTSGDLL